MATHVFQVDGVDVTFEAGAFKESIYYDHELVSQQSKLVPRLTHVHRFTAGTPPRQFELRSYEMGGWIMTRDGHHVADRQPGKALPVLFGLMMVIGWAEYAVRPDRVRFSTVLATAACVLSLVGFWSWRRAKRESSAAVRHSRVS